MPRNKKSVFERFWNLVEVRDPDNCWYWKASTTSKGHGQFNIGNKMIYAHRYALLGEKCLDEKGIVCHKCDHSSCCNPAHLYLGTHMDNICDRMDRNLSIGMSNRKLYSGEVWLIKKLKERGLFQREIAPMFKVSRATISHAINNPNFPVKDI